MILEIKVEVKYSGKNIPILKSKGKMETCKNMGYNFLFIIDKNYDEFKNTLLNTKSE